VAGVDGVLVAGPVLVALLLLPQPAAISRVTATIANLAFTTCMLAAGA
jgi:hypothetical protein